jgi:release factor glutamine methyltransferase
LKTADAVALIAARLAVAGISDPRREARHLLAAALKSDAGGLLAVNDVDPAAFEPMLARREAHEPLAYITGAKEFWSLNFFTSPATLIPRPDSETLVSAALEALPDRESVKRILDLGAGTGCLLLACLTEFGTAFGVGVDIAPDAAALAARNAAALGLAGRAAFLAGDWAAAINATFNLVLSNPPYIPDQDIAGLMPDVALFEPHAALAGGADGLAAYRIICAALPRLLAPGGVAVVEMGAGQAKDFAAIVAANGLEVTFRQDFSGHDRAAVIRPK